ncbi:MAG: mycofactocin biosynthesis peptidyl-dipeptidase MftE [Microthrixaceae bacterium]
MGDGNGGQDPPATDLLGDATWSEVASGGPLLLAAPVGSCEQHGPHLPLSTDTLLAESLAAALAAARPGVVVAPSIGIGASGEHESFPGTLSIGTGALTTVLVELARSALPAATADRQHQPAFTGVLFVNGHGGNLEATERAVAQLRAESRRVASWHPRVPGGDLHAGATETSLMLHLHPQLVRTPVAGAGPNLSGPELLSELERRDLAEVAPSGVLGDPGRASAPQGAELFEQLLTQLLGAATDLVETRAL